ncbi:MAG: YbaK/EbsC family protein [Desulfovibrionaceae bacterium]|nr:YbaK/EbsC family protein [Desulfovibrionaceae bacterium]
MFHVSEPFHEAPAACATELQRAVYAALAELGIPFERTETDEAVTMGDCAAIEEKMRMRMVKTLFLCDRKKEHFYLFVTRGDKPFHAAAFSRALNVSRVSFAPVPLMESMLGTKVGAATVFSALLDREGLVSIVLDREVCAEPWYGCSDGTTTNYLKLATADMLERLLPATGHEARIIEA